MLHMLALLAALAVPLGASAGTTLLVSAPEGGGHADANCYYGHVSADGNWVAFTSFATNLVPSNPPGNQAYLRDLVGSATSAVGCAVPSPSGDAHFIACPDSHTLAVVDRLLSTKETYDTDVHNAAAPDITSDGRFVMYQHVLGDTSLLDRTGMTTTAVPSVQGVGGLSADGSLVVVETYVGSTGPYVALFHPTTNTTEIVSIDPTTGTPIPSLLSGSRTISADGRYVLFSPIAASPTGGSGISGTFVRDRLLGTVERVAVTTGGVPVDVNGANISGDGRIVQFVSRSSYVVPLDLNGSMDVFAHDRLTGRTVRVNVHDDGTEAGPNDDPTLYPDISGDGRVMTFATTAPLVTDASSLVNVYAHRSVCGDATIDPGEECDLGAANGASGSCCTAACTIDAGTTPDADGDGWCDATDPCLGGVTLTSAKLSLSHIGTPGAGRLAFSGRLTLPGLVEPDRRGARVVLRDAAGNSLIDLHVPVPRFDRTLKFGWRVATNGSSRVFVNGTPLIGGLTTFNLRRASGAPGSFRVRLKTRRATYAAPGTLPLRLTVVLDDSTDATATCADTTFVPASCSGSGATLVCR